MAQAVFPTVTYSSWGGLGAAGTAQAAANTFVPKKWADELLIQREVNMVAANFFKRINFKGKKGDTLVIPFISDLTANAKTPATGVTVQANAEGLKTVLIDQHYEVSQLFEDILNLQSMYDLKAEYVKKAGYALAKTIDSQIYTALIAALSSTYKVVGADGSTAWATGSDNQSDITDAGLRRAIQTLDDNLVPDSDRALIIPPSQKSALLGIDKFVLANYIGRTKEIQTGTFGEIYGIPVKISTNLPSGTSTGSGAASYRVAFLAHKDAICTAVQQDVRVQNQYKQEYLGNLVTSDMVWGVKALRTDDADTTGSNYRKSHCVAIYTK